MKSILLCAAAAAALTTFGQAAAAAPKPRFPIRRESVRPLPLPATPVAQPQAEPVEEAPPVTAPVGEVASSSLPPLARREPVETAPAEPAERRPVLTLASAVTVAQESAPASAPVYTMQSGDTLTGVSRRFKTTVTRLRALNDLSAEASIKAGQKIRLPGDAVDTGTEPFAKGPAPVLAAVTRRAEAPARAVVPRPTPPPPAPRTLAVTPRVSPPVAAAAAPPRVVADPEVAAPQPVAASARTEPAPAQSRPVVAEATPPPAPVRRIETPPPAVEPVRTVAQAAPPPAALSRPFASAAASAAVPPAAAAATASIPTNLALTPAEAGRGRFVWPVRGEVLSSFGPKGPGQSKDGLNIAAREGDPVLAAASGEVVYAGDQVAPFGKLVLLKHDGGWVTAYAHLSEISVKMKDRVSQSGVIGKAGRTGAVPTPQLYFEVRYAPSAKDKARPVDPMPLLPQ